MSSEIKANKISPATGTDFTFGDSGDTFTVPSGTTLDIASGATLDTTGATVSGLTTGKVLQVVQTVKSDTFTGTSNGSEISVTGMSATITPTSSSSKIMISVVLNYSCQATTWGAYLKRGTTIIGVGATAGSRQSVASGLGSTVDYNQQLNGKIEYLDSPATTSATTYQLFAINDNTVQIAINRGAVGSGDGDGSASKRSISTITLMEIGA